MIKRTFATDSLLLFLLAAVLIGPLFRLKYVDNWPSIESTFISDARMLSEHLPHPGWQPLWYCGTRFDYIYPPALRYGTALISKAARVSTARAYHIYAALYYAFGIVAVYWMVLAGCGSRKRALVAAGAAALLSPAFWLLPDYRHDSAYWVPQRLHVLMSYGEGPHISAFSTLPAALAASFVALRKWRPPALAAAGALCALTVANNFYGATALAILFPIVVWSVWLGERKLAVWSRAIAIPALAYGLSAFWLTPSYLRITAVNLKWVSQPGNAWSLMLAVIVVALFCALTFDLAWGKPEHTWSTFVTGSGILLGLYVLGRYYIGFSVTGEALRLVPELDLALILVLIEVIRVCWKRLRWRACAVVLAVIVSSPALIYVRHAWTPFRKAGSLSSQYEYKITKWVHENLPDERVLASGTVRYWFDAWFDNAQPDGGSAQGMLDQIIPVATWQIEAEKRGELAVLWLQALGTDAVVVPDKTSLDGYRDYRTPEKFRGLVPALFDDGHGTVVYRIPRRYPGLGRVVDLAAIQSIGAVKGGDDGDTLTRYVGVVENGRQSATPVSWRSTDEAAIQASTLNGQTVLFQETYDPSWHAYENGKEISIRPERVMGFMLIDVPPGQHAIDMRFEAPLENRVGRIAFAITVLIMLALFRGPFRRFGAAFRQRSRRSTLAS